MTQQPLEGRVAAILSDYQLVINIGEEQGVKTGMYFDILGPPLEIKDPLTNAVLDKIDRSKVEVRAAEVRRNVTICSTFRTTPGSSASSVFTGEVLERLKANPQRLTGEDSYIQIGDMARQVLE